MSSTTTTTTSSHSWKALELLYHWHVRLDIGMYDGPQFYGVFFPRMGSKDPAGDIEEARQLCLTAGIKYEYDKKCISYCKDQKVIQDFLQNYNE